MKDDMSDSSLDIGASAARYDSLNLGLATGYMASVVVAYFVIPLLVRWDGAVWAYALIPLTLAANGYWATLHEAIHGQLRPRTDRNRWAGRALAILWGSSFRVLRFGHLMHHRFNRHQLDHPDCYDPRETGALSARARFYGEILGGLYLLEILTPPLYLLPQPMVRRLVSQIYAGSKAPMPQLRQLAERALASPANIAEIRQDALAAWALMLLAFFAWGNHWPLFLAFLLGRGLLVSLVDNVYHFRTPLDKVDFAYNLSLPAPLQALFLNMNLHRVHHHNMHVPWWQLPTFFAIDRDSYDGSLIKGVLHQARGPLAVTPSGDSALTLDAQP